MLRTVLSPWRWATFAIASKKVSRLPLVFNSRHAHTLSKTTFNLGLQCEKQLYLHKNHKRMGVSKESFSDHEQQIMQAGQKVGRLAHSLFPGGVDCSPASYFDFKASTAKTTKMVKLRMPVLYEAAFQATDVLVAVDILVKGEGAEWHMYEVKSSTSVKEEHIDEAALQAQVLEQSGVELASVNIIHIDKNYIRQGAVDVLALFNIEDVTARVRAKSSEISSQVEEFKTLLSAPQPPEVPVGSHCFKPYPCKFSSHCFSQADLPPTCSVLDLKSTKKWQLLHDLGVKSTRDIPDHFPLTDIQTVQVKCDKSDLQEHCDVPKLTHFLQNELKYPLAYLVRRGLSYPALSLMLCWGSHVCCELLVFLNGL